MKAGGGAGLLIAGLLAAATAGHAGASEVETRIERPLDLSDTRLYVPFTGFFTADTDEALLTVSRYANDCIDAGQSCTLDSECASGTCRSGNCRYPESVRIAYAAVVRRARYCAIAACGPGGLPPECPSGTCDGSACADPASNVNGLCLCGACGETDPVLAAADLVFADTFADPVDPRWTLAQAAFATDATSSYLKMLKPVFTPPDTRPTSPWVSYGQIHLFGLQPGESYVLVLKWSYAPYPGPVPCGGSSGLTIHLEPVPSVCAP